MTPNSPTNITLVISSLGSGGAERVMTLLAGEWVRRGKQVTLLTLSSPETDHYAVPAGVSRVALDVLKDSHGKLQALRNNIRRLSRLREAIRQSQPDVVISFMDVTNVQTIIATGGMKIPVVVSERIDPRHYPVGAGWARLRKLLYPQASALVVQTRAVQEWAADMVPAQKIHVIPNPVTPHVENTGAEALPLPQDFILGMGRLERQKGFDILLEAYACLAQPRPPLVIAGEGSLRASLEQLARELKLEGEVQFTGRVQNPADLFARARMFVLSSRYEGFPNVLIEAMAAGLPVVAFDCPSGPAEIIQHDHNGLLVTAEEETQLAEAMHRLLADRELSARLGENARGVVDKFSLPAVVDQWDELVDQIFSGRGKP